MARSIPVIDFADYVSGDENRKSKFIAQVGDSLKDIGFFALKNHGIPIDLIKQSYDKGDEFFGLSADTKMNYAQREIAHQRGYTAFGVEHAKDNPAPDLRNSGKPAEHTSRGKVRPIQPMFGQMIQFRNSRKLSMICIIEWNPFPVISCLLAVFIWAKKVIG